MLLPVSLKLDEVTLSRFLIRPTPPIVGVGDIDLNKLVEYHNSHNCIGTVTAVRPPSRFGELNIDKNSSVKNFEEKPQMGGGLINGGFFIFNKKILSHLKAEDNCDFEFGPLQKLARNHELKAYKHNGFWQCMDTKRDKDNLEEIYQKGPPWLR